MNKVVMFSLLVCLDMASAAEADLEHVLTREREQQAAINYTKQPTTINGEYMRAAHVAYKQYLRTYKAAEASMDKQTVSIKEEKIGYRVSFQVPYAVSTTSPNASDYPEGFAMSPENGTIHHIKSLSGIIYWIDKATFEIIKTER